MLSNTLMKMQNMPEQKCSIGNVLSKMQDCLACTICLDLLSNPVTTKCGHTFCKLCLERTLQVSRSSVPCPLCVTPITKRSFQTNKKISALVNSVRKVIMSIKADCGFQEVLKRRNPLSVDLNDSLDEQQQTEESSPIKRAMRKREHVSYYSNYVLAHKRRNTNKIKEFTSTVTKNVIRSLEETKSTSESFHGFHSTENKEDVAGSSSKPHKEEVVNAPSLNHYRVSPSGRKSIEKVQKWLNQNQSRDSEVVIKEPPFSQEQASSDEDLVPTQVFDPKEFLANEGKLNENLDFINKGDIASQSTIEFDCKDVKIVEGNVNKNLAPEGIGNCKGAKDVGLGERDLLGSEKENEGISGKSKDKLNKGSRSKKCILSELNKVNSTNFTEKTLAEPENESNILKKDLTSVNQLTTDLQHVPNKKGHNIRFASEIKTKFLEPAIPSKLTSSTKAKKSPGWSRVEGARKELKSKHTSLSIKGGEGKNCTVKSNVSETSKLPASSQESVFVIEENESPSTSLDDVAEKGFKKPYLTSVKNKISNIQTKKQEIKSNIRQATKIRTKNIINEGKIIPKSDGIIPRSNENSTKGQIIQKSPGNGVNNVKPCVKLRRISVTTTVDDIATEEPNIFSHPSSSSKESKPSLTTTRTNSFKGRLSRRNIKNKTNIASLGVTDDSLKVPLNNDTLKTSVNVQDKDELMTNIDGKPDSLQQDIDFHDINFEFPKTKVGIQYHPEETTMDIDENENKMHLIGDNKGNKEENEVKNEKSSVISSIPEKIPPEKRIVPFVSRGNLDHLRNSEMPCQHSVPCELYSVLLKFSGYLMSHPCHRIFSSEQSHLCSSNKMNSDHNHIPDNHSIDLPKENNPPSEDFSIIPESNISQFENEVAIELPDKIQGILFKIKDNEDFDEIPKVSQKGGFEGSVAIERQNNEYQADDDNDILKDIDLDCPILENSSKCININAEYEDVERDEVLSMNSGVSHHSLKSEQTLIDTVPDINTTCGVGKMLSNTNTDKSVSDTTHTQSPINFKRTKRIHALDSESSSSEDEAFHNVRKRRKPRPSIESSPSTIDEKVPQIDSEELRDFERYDENIWRYYQRKQEESIQSSIKENEKSATHSTDFGRLEGTEDDVIAGTEVLKNVQSDLDLIKKMRTDAPNNNDVLIDMASSQEDTINIFSQDSVQTTSTINGMSASTRDLFKKCNKSLNLAKQILYVPSQSTIKCSDQENSSNIAMVERKSTSCSQAETTTEDSNENATTDDTRLSVLSTQSVVISTQKRDNVKNEVEELRNQILALENAMEEKKLKLAKEENEKETVSMVINDGNNAETKDNILGSDVDSEELFGTFSVPSNKNHIEVNIKGKTLSTTKIKEKEEKPITVICTGLSQSEIGQVQTLISKLGGKNSSMESKWCPQTTHVIVQTDEENMTERTLKYLFGVASKAWVISLDWVKNSLNSNKLLPEKDYEALDCTGAPGPMRWRLLSTPIFKGCQFSLVPPFEDITTEQLTDLIEISGGSTVKTFDHRKHGIKLFVMNSVEPRQDINSLPGYNRRNKLTVSSDWLIECIGMCSLVSLGSYIIGPSSPKEITASGIPGNLMFDTQEF